MLGKGTWFSRILDSGSGSAAYLGGVSPLRHRFPHLYTEKLEWRLSSISFF